MVLREKGPMLVGVLWVEVFICMVVLGLRLYTRTMIRRNIGWDDLLLLIAWVSVSILLESFLYFHRLVKLT